jgi:hypothetical protein
MDIGRFARIAAAAATACIVAAGAGVAGDCEVVAKAVKRTIDKVDPDKAGSNTALKCAMFSEGLGMLKMFRLLQKECLDEGAKRTRELAELDRTIRKTMGMIDSTCQ